MHDAVKELLYQISPYQERLMISPADAAITPGCQRDTERRKMPRRRLAIRFRHATTPCAQLWLALASARAFRFRH